MKKIKLIIGLILIGMLLFGCIGLDGTDGRIYLRIDLIDCVRYWDNNDSIPFGFSVNSYYRCFPGSYSFEYETTSGREWSGTYTVTSEKGSPGGFMYDGEDGRDRFYTLACHPNGPSLTYYHQRNDGMGKTIQPQIADEDNIEIIHSDGIYRFHLHASRKPGTQKTKTKI
ncbi:MAG: hypothetical protein GX122_07560 [Candidatus Cloacimonetes bacterium]|nr:hypothetical protein [Candidatus Cloacimonadota bacterium]NLO12258.1 hypothetical protein [Candidatus Cloacimonadota bacterium]